MTIGIKRIIASLIFLANAPGPLLAQHSQLQIQLEGTITIKKEPTEVGSLIEDVGPISELSRSIVQRSGILGGFERAKLIPNGTEFSINNGIQFNYKGVPYTIVLIPAVRAGCLVNYFAVYAFDGSGKDLGFVSFEREPGTFSIRDEHNSGIDFRYEKGMIQAVTVAPASGSVWQCIGNALQKRIRADTLAKFGIEAGLCAFIRVSCVGLAVDVSALAVGVGSDCIGR